MKLLPATTAVCLALALTPAAAVQVPPSVIAAYQAGLRGDAGANHRAIEQLGKLAKQDPADPLTAALLGASETVHARYVERPWEKIQFSEKGLARLEKSLQLLDKRDAENAPGRMSVHDQVVTTVGCTFVAVPPMFHRFDEGYTLLQKLVVSKSFTGAGGRQQAHAYLCAAQAAMASDDHNKAETYIADLIKAAPEGPLRARADQLKAKLDK